MVDLGELEQETVGIPTRGGADSSLERNNVYALQPRVYVEGLEESGQEGLHIFPASFQLFPPLAPSNPPPAPSAWKSTPLPHVRRGTEPFLFRAKEYSS